MDMTPAAAAAVDQRRPQAGAALTLQAVHKRFDRFTALQSVSLQVRQGEMLCLGENRFPVALMQQTVVLTYAA